MPNIVNIDDATETPFEAGRHWLCYDKPLTPAMVPREGRLGVRATRVPPGKSGCPFHTHQAEDEVFFVLSGRGVLRYGDAVRPIKAGDCISCPADTGIGHQIANPYDDGLVYLAIGMNDPNEVCTHPDSGKILVRSLGQTGYLKPADYMDGEPDPPRIFVMASGS